jgi:hypothetical protein
MITQMNEALKAWMKSEDREMFGGSGPLTLQDSKLFEFAFSAGWVAKSAEIPPITSGPGYRQTAEHREAIRQGVLAAIEARKQGK